LPEQVQQRELTVASAEVSFDQRAQAKALVQLAGQQQPGVGGAPELDADLGVERGANRARFRVTHWVVPSEPARSLGGRVFSRLLSHDTPLHSRVISGIRT